MKLLLTGGTGFFGKSLLKFIVKTNFQIEVTVLTRSSKNFLINNPQFSGLPWLSFHNGDVTRPESLKHLACKGEFTHLIHAATDSTNASALSSHHQFNQIVNGTLNLLDFAINSKIHRFLLTSSGGVYGPQPLTLESIPESFLGMPDPLLFGSTYGIAKRMAEHLCILASTNSAVETVIARCFAFVGEDLPIDAHFAIGNFIRDAKHKQAIVVKGDGTPLRSYLYQQDLAQWLFTLLEKGNSGEAYNVGSDQVISIAELAHLVRDIVAPGKPVIIEKSFSADNAQRNRYIPNIDKARNMFGLDVRVSLEKAIRLAAGIH
jgi:UDP-glucuronate decarboxylase